MEYKVQINSLENFKAWSGGLTTLNTVRERGGVDTLTVIVKISSLVIRQQKDKSMTGSGLIQILSTKL